MYSFCIWAFNVFICCEFLRIHFGVAHESVCRLQAVLVRTNLFVFCSVAVQLYHMTNKHPCLLKVYSFLKKKKKMFPVTNSDQNKWTKLTQEESRYHAEFIFLWQMPHGNDEKEHVVHMCSKRPARRSLSVSVRCGQCEALNAWHRSKDQRCIWPRKS